MLPLTVLLFSVIVEYQASIPPTYSLAVLPLTVLLFSVTVEELIQIPPTFSATLPLTVEPFNVTMADSA